LLFNDDSNDNRIFESKDGCCGVSSMRGMSISIVLLSFPGAVFVHYLDMD
jgi:hypothetical protein